MIARFAVVYLCVLMMMGCNKAQFEECNNLVDSCSEHMEGDYCLFGFKWGEDPFFIDSGLQAAGPGTTGGVLTFSFVTKATNINTHSENNVSAVSFDNILDCARDEVRSALSQYAKVANLEFTELNDNRPADLTFRAAHLTRQSAIGYPNYSHGPCKDIAGNIIFAPSEFTDCHTFFIIALHEIGHALGLGHVNTSNIMAPGGDKFSFDGLQEGDVKGVISIYGTK